MATTASPPPFSRSSSLSVTRSPDTASLIYPERAIRPLPKSRLKAKLSPDQASTIVFPPDPPPISPTLSFAGKENVDGGGNQATGRMTNGNAGHAGYMHNQGHHHHDTPIHSHCTCGEEIDSADDEVEFDHPDYRYALHRADGTPVLDNVERRLNEDARFSTKPPPSASATSSVDGYESFENMSNKKKRKIPLSATSSMHQSQLSAEMASMGINGPVDGAMDDVLVGQDGLAMPYGPPPPAVASSSGGTGISGAGRGRYGRQNGRSDHGIRRPLGSSSVNSINGYHPRPPAKSGGEVRSPSDTDLENTGGIISQAIKSAAEQGPITPHKGQELASLLQTATNGYSTPATAKTQFTFSVESESSTKMVDDRQALHASTRAAYEAQLANTRGANGSAASGGSRGSAARGTQPAPALPNGTLPQTPGNAARPPPNAPNQQQQQQPAPVPAPKPKPRRRPSKEYAIAARQRRLQQEYSNYHHRPNKDNMWICEFCEYEDIFGEPPLALIRQYEIKDRQERKRQAEKRRLLEKAKAKNRKGKKGKKGGGGNAATAAANANAGLGGGQHYDPNLLPPDDGDYYDDDEYGDEYEPGGLDEGYPDEYLPPPAPVGTPQGVGGGGGRLSG